MKPTSVPQGAPPRPGRAQPLEQVLTNSHDVDVDWPKERLLGVFGLRQAFVSSSPFVLPASGPNVAWFTSRLLGRPHE